MQRVLGALLLVAALCMTAGNGRADDGRKPIQVTDIGTAGLPPIPGFAGPGNRRIAYPDTRESAGAEPQCGGRRADPHPVAMRKRVHYGRPQLSPASARPAR